MAKLFALLFALCVVPSIVTAVEQLCLKGAVQCDPCLVGFETNVSRPIAGAIVEVRCTERIRPFKVTYTQRTKTNSLGQYLMYVPDNQTVNVCDVFSIESGDPTCNATSKGRSQARVILTSYNGMSNPERFANTMLFQSDAPLANCKQILQMYQEAEDED